MRRFLDDAKGAVTVFVTLLLIPAILVSGSAVDLARIFAARSIIQDANQLAANSVLTQYNALLYDLYGVMGVAKDDPILGSLLDDYISVAVFGERLPEEKLGALEIFYGSELSVDEVGFGTGKNLRDADVLRRQIEEYMKFRGPVIIVKQFLDAFKDNKIKEDTELLEKKLEIDSSIADLYNKYQELYDAIVLGDKCDQMIGGIAGSYFGTISSRLKAIRSDFVALRACYAAWENLVKRLDNLSSEIPDPAERSEKADEISADIDDKEAHYRAILENIKAYTIGGQHGSNWRNGRWGSITTVASLNSFVEGAKRVAENFKPNFDNVVNIAREIDGMNGELSRKVDELEKKLNDGQCSPELRAGLMERSGTPPMTLIERYRDILKWKDITSMATVYRDGGYSYIDDSVKPMLDGVCYRNADNPSAGSLSRTELEGIPSDPRFALSSSVSASNSMAARYAAFPDESVRYHMPPGYKKFAEHPGENRPFFDALKAMLGAPQLAPVKLYDGQKDEPGENAKKKQRNLIDALLNLVEQAYTGLANNPLGAKYIKDDSGAASIEKAGILGIAKLIPESMNNDVMKAFHDPLGCLGSAGDYLLLLTYCTSMFSNYTTTRPDSIGKTMSQESEIDFPKSVTGIPISPKVNYFFQSEWEYLYSGNYNAAKNLNAITRLLFIVRLVCNYIVVFSVSEISSIVSSIQTAFAWCPPLGLVLGELARAAFVAAESLIDIAVLRTGHKVKLIKSVSDNEWVCSPKGILNAVNKVLEGEILHGGDPESGSETENGEEKEKGLTYENYMQFFFLAKALITSGAATELTERTADLIEWNMINYASGANADERKMAEAMAAGNRFKMVDMITDFNITTSVNMHMLFLSMPFAERGIDGVFPPRVMPITVTDYRGY